MRAQAQGADATASSPDGGSGATPASSAGGDAVPVTGVVPAASTRVRSSCRRRWRTPWAWLRASGSGERGDLSAISLPCLRAQGVGGSWAMPQVGRARASVWDPLSSIAPERSTSSIDVSAASAGGLVRTVNASRRPSWTVGW